AYVAFMRTASSTERVHVRHVAGIGSVKFGKATPQCVAFRWRRNDASRSEPQQKFLKWLIEEIRVVEEMIQRRALSSMGMDEVCSSSSSLSSFSSHRQVVAEEHRSSGEEAGVKFGKATPQCVMFRWRRNSYTFCSAGGGAVEGFSIDFGWKTQFSARFHCKKLAWRVRIAGEASYRAFFAKYYDAYRGYLSSWVPQVLCEPGCYLGALSRYLCCTVEVCVV
ncbi:hypothetical protein Taro_025395, partial [Colocasia esculenta]|nr:hypothetical protein [Colocasia esculenta]